MAETVKGARDLQRRLTLAGSVDARVGPRILKRWQIRTTQLAKIAAPKQTGHLKQSIHPGAIGSRKAQVEASAPYAGYVEGGTKAHWIRPVHAKMLAWGGPRRLTGELRVGGKATNFARLVHHPGTTAQPFLLPSGEQAAKDGNLLSEVVIAWNEGA